MNKKTLVLKLSGGALKDSNNPDILSTKKLIDLAKQIKLLQKDYQLTIIVGGGNI